MNALHRQHSLGFQLSWRIGLVSLITVVSLIGVIVAGSVVTLLMTQQQLKQEAVESSRTFDLFLQNIGSSLFARGANLSHVHREERNMIMLDILQHHATIFELLLISPEGDILAQQRRSGVSDKTTIEEQPWLTTVQDGNIYWGEVDTQSYGVPFLDVAVPFHTHEHDHQHGRKQFGGTLLARLDLTALWDTVAAVRVGDTGYAYIMSDDGQLLAYRDIAQLRNIPSVFDLIEETPHTMLADDKSLLPTIRTGINDKLVVADAVFLSTIAWVAVVEEPLFEALQQYYLPLAVALVLMFIVFGVVANIVYFTQKKIVQPLVTLRHHVLAFQQGTMQSEIQLPYQDNNEMGLLAATFNQMARQLRELISGLEQQVTERTAQLAHAVQEAEDARGVAEHANDLKTKFIANMSHELRTPLNSIINFTYIVKSGVRGPVTEEQIEYLDRVQASGEHLLGMINDILDLSKIEAGRMELFKEEIQLRELVMSSLSSAIGLTKDKPIELHHDIPDELPHIKVDRTRIRQVLLNLLSNAAKFTDEGSITVRMWCEGNELITSITDTGTGIPPDKFETIFEDFRQADEGSDRSYEGTGLGLPICKKLIEMHEGRIWMESEVGVGSTFFFSLPLIELEVATTDVSDPIPEVVGVNGAFLHSGTPILVIDDDLSASEIVRSYLQQDGYTVHSINDGKNTVEEARRIQPAAIILDILMPHKDGWEVLSELKATPDLRDIPVICYTIVDDARLGLSLGASAYLVKPIESHVLRETVRQFTDDGGYVLVIDDDPDVQEMVEHYLGQQGYEVGKASNGREGLDQIAARQPNLVILDLMMPEMDGFGVIEHMEQDTALRDIPVVVLTAKDLTLEEQQHLAERVQGLLVKAMSTPTDMLARVRVLLQQHHKNERSLC